MRRRRPQGRSRKWGAEIPRLCVPWAGGSPGSVPGPQSHSLIPGDRSPQPGRGGAGRKDGIPASAMEAPAPSLTEEDLTEVKKDVSSSARLGAARRVGAEESGNPEPSDEELLVRKSARSGHSTTCLHPGRWLEVTHQRPRSPRLNLPEPA